jgi:hypothetical protein
MQQAPVLFIIFNRPEITQKTFAQIRKAKPKKLFVAADGPRQYYPDDHAKCMAAREIIRQIDWKCDLQTLFREENRGCGHGPAEAITWFFEHVEDGIIIEDDCLPFHSFFRFCSELLERYNENERIWIISGYNPHGQWYPKRSSYLISSMGGLFGGWATWRRAWKHFDYSAKRWFSPQGKKRVQDALKNKNYFDIISKDFDHYFASERRDVWDFQWVFARLYHSGLCIVPSFNQIANIGFGKDATHTINPNYKIPTVTELGFPLKHPLLKVDHFYQWMTFERFLNPKPRTLVKKIILKLLKIYSNTAS